MPTGQQYATNVPQTLLTSGITAVATSMPVQSATGFPAPPFTAVIDIGTSSQEPVDVTAVGGLNFTITRAIDGTSAFAHSTGATVTHADIGRDFREARAHIDAGGPTDTAGESVHGLTSGVVVGTSQAQTLSNKTISAATFTGAQTMGSGAWTGTGILTDDGIGVAGLTGSNDAPMRFVGVVSSGAPGAGTFIKNDVAYDQDLHTMWVCTAGGTPGTWVKVSGGETYLGRVNPGAVGTFDFTVPAGYRAIKCVWAAGITAGNAAQLSMQINSVATATYTNQRLEANAAAVSSAFGPSATAIQVGTIVNASSAPMGSGSFIVDGADGATNQNWSVNGSSTGTFDSTHSFIGLYGGTGNNVSTAITKLTIFSTGNTFYSASTFSFYGLQ